MTILYHPGRLVNRNTTFGLGIAKPARERRLPVGPSAADRAWAAYELNKDCRDYSVDTTAEDRRFDRMAADSAEMDRAERGIRGF